MEHDSPPTPKSVENKKTYLFTSICKTNYFYKLLFLGGLGAKKSNYSNKLTA